MLETLKNIVSVGGPAQGFLRPIDTKRIAREVELDKRGAENGSRNLPPSTATKLDSVEQDIVQRLEGEWTWQGDELLNQLNTYATRLIGCSVDAEFEKLQVKARNTLVRLRAAHLAAERDLGPRRQEFLGHRDDLAAFKSKHRLKRSVRHPGRHLTTIGLLIFLVAVESLLNGAFFADTAARGLVGGVGIAIGISVLNVLVAYALGAGPTRWLRHRNWGIKLVALIGLLGGVAFLAGLHGVAFHLREASVYLAETNPLFTPQEALDLAISNIANEPFALHDLDSFYLFSLGIVFAVAAYLKGYRSDDPYPGYGAHARRKDAAREAYSDVHGDLFDDLTRAKEETVKAIEHGLDRIPRLPQESEAIRVRRATTLEQFRAYEIAVESAANQLLQRYRECNSRSRSDPVPAYFDERWALPFHFTDSPKVKERIADAGGVAIDIPAALRTLRDLLNEVFAEYEALLRAYPHPTQMD